MPKSTSKNWDNFKLDDTDRKQKNEHLTTQPWEGYMAKPDVKPKKAKSENTEFYSGQLELLKYEGSKVLITMEQVLAKITEDSTKPNFQESPLCVRLVRIAQGVSKRENLDDPLQLLQWLTTGEIPSPYGHHLSDRRLQPFAMQLARKFNCLFDRTATLSILKVIGKSTLDLEMLKKQEIGKSLNWIKNNEQNKRASFPDGIRDSQLGKIVLNWAKISVRNGVFESSIAAIHWLSIVGRPGGDSTERAKVLCKEQSSSLRRKVNKEYGVSLNDEETVLALSAVAYKIYNPGRF